MNNEIDINSLQLDIDNPFIQLTDPTKNQFIKVTTTVRDINGKPLNNIKLFVSDDSGLNLQQVEIYDKNQQSIIEITQEDGHEGFYITSENNGEIVFFIHPIHSESLIIKLLTKVENSTGFIPAKYTIYIVNTSLDNISHGLPEPEIVNSWGEDIKSNGESKFTVLVEKYPKAQIGDSILFFVNNEYTKQSIEIRETNNINNYSSNIPYAIFAKDEESSFYYVVIGSNSYIESSGILTLTYKGRPNKPWTDVQRIYEPCVVYDSVDVSPDNILQQMDYINTDEISNYRNNPDNAGLFIQVTGSNNPNDKEKVPLGSKVYLNLYINSSSRTVTHTFNNKVPNIPDNNGNTASCIFNIPHHFLINCLAYQTGGGDIYFDYQVGSDEDNDVTYSKIWHGYINTPDIE